MKRYAIAAAVIVAAVIGWRALGSRDDRPARRASKPGATAIDAPARAPRVTRGGDEPDEEEAKAASAKKRPRRAALPPGVVIVDQHPVHRVEEQSEANRKSVEEAKETGKHPERLDPKVEPAPFDRMAWDRDPQGYLDIVEPGRVWQSADDRDGVEAIEAEGPIEVTLDRGGETKVAVRSEPLSPVTFTSMGGGALDNGLTSITVRADPSGFAGVRFRATDDARATVTIVAGSPMASGQVNFTVRVR